MSDIVPRRTWCALPPVKTLARIVTPTPRLWLHHGATGTSTVNTACSYVKYHIRTHGWSDVGYSFLIAGGKVLEGRGAGRVGAHTRGDNIQSHGICMVGNYESRLPNTADVDALVWLVRHGMEQGWWVGPLTGGHRDAPGASTSCPGRRLWEHIPEINRQVTAPEPEPEDDMAAETELAAIAAALAAGAQAREGRNELERVRLELAAAGEVARIRQSVGLPADPESDGIWAQRLTDGEASVKQVGEALAAKNVEV